MATVSIPDGSSAEDVQRVLNTVYDWMKSNLCPAYLVPVGQCALAPHASGQHETAARDGYTGQVVTVYWDAKVSG